MLSPILTETYAQTTLLPWETPASIRALVGEREAAGVAQHLRMGGQPDIPRPIESQLDFVWNGRKLNFAERTILAVKSANEKN